MLSDFRFTDREGRTFHRLLVVLKGDEQLWRLPSQRHEMLGVSNTHRLGQGDQGRPVIDGIDQTQQLRRDLEDVAHEDIELPSTVMIECADLRDGRHHAEFREQLLHSHRAQFRPGHSVATGQQPPNIERLAAERQEYTAAFRKRQLVEIFHQQRVRFTLVKADFIAGPPVMPKLCFHALRPF